MEMFKKVGDSKAVYDLIKNDPDEHAKKEAFRDLAETAAELMDYDDAAKWYGQSGDTGEQIDCLIRGNMFGELEVLARALPDDSDFMEVLRFQLSNYISSVIKGNGRRVHFSWYV